jgi:hypothetical protein
LIVQVTARQKQLCRVLIVQVTARQKQLYRVLIVQVTARQKQLYRLPLSAQSENDLRKILLRS